MALPLQFQNAIFKEYDVKKAAVFGSAARGDVKIVSLYYFGFCQGWRGEEKRV